MTAEDFIELNVQKTKSDTPPGLAIVTKDDAINCCEEYAKQQAIAFLDGIREYIHESACDLYADDRTSEEFYNLFIQRQQ